MFQSYFGMTRRPFGATPQLGTYFPAAGQEEALATIRYCLTQGRGIAVVTGGAGTGKTLLCRRIASCLDSAFATAMIANTNMTSVKALLQAILYDLALPYHGMDEQELRLTLTDYLLGKYEGGGRTVLVVDEAHNLTVPLLEELRMLENLDGEDDKLFQIVLAGDHRLANLLRRPDLESLNQCVGARATLGPLSDEETVAYIVHQLECAGVVPESVFTYEAMTAAYEATLGVPRRINQLCERALLVAYVAEAAGVDVETIEHANAELNGREAEVTSDAADLASAVSVVAPATSVEQPASALRVHRPSVDEADISSFEAIVAGTIPTAHEWFVDAVPAEIDSEPADELDDCLEIIDDDAIDVEITEGEVSCEQTIAIEMPKCRATEPPAVARELSPLMLDFAPRAKPDNPAPPQPATTDEEIVVDRYAQMDAARATRRRISLTTNSETRPLPPVSMPIAVPAATVKPCAAPPRHAPLSVDAEPSQTTIEPAPPLTEVPAAPLFVGASDNPAVHEVGAGIGGETPTRTEATLSEPPILVIEGRSQRTRDNRLRIDGPQPAVEPRVATYRRLFSRARKDEPA